jgi:putative FmdB family regulatory protein
MPVYEYFCPSCEQRFEKLGSMSARNDQVPCPSCPVGTGERLVSKFAAFSVSGGTMTSIGGGCCGGGGGCACAG